MGVTVRLEVFLTFLGMLIVTFGSRYAGLTLRGELPPFWLRFLRFVPIAVFAALVVPEIPGSRGEGLERVIAAVLGGLAAWRVKQLWVAVLVGMAAFWLLRAI
jgi:branched-subunit amino acid transport protein